MSPTADDLVAQYLRRLRRELRTLPRPRRRELIEEIAEHVAAGRAELRDEREAEIRALLDRIGEPEEIAAEARERFGVSDERAGVREVLAIPLLLIGGLFIPVLGWFAGVALLWTSPIWSRRDKLLGTLLVPGGWATAAWVSLFTLGVGELCTGSVVTTASGRVIDNTTCASDHVTLAEVLFAAALVVVIVGPLLVAVRLAWCLRGRFAHAQR